MSDAGGCVALDGAPGRRLSLLRGSRCRYSLYPHEQCTAAFDQWTRMVENMVNPTTKSKATPSTQSVADQGLGCGGLPGLTAVDFGLVRLVKGSSLRQRVPSSNGCLDGHDQGGEDGSSLDGGRTVTSPLVGPTGQGDGIPSREYDDHDPCCHRRMTPWKYPGKCYSPGLVGLHEEIVDFYAYMRPLPEEQEMRSDIVLRMKQIVMELWPSAEMKVFGSFETDLYLPTSDIDLVVICDDIDPQMALKMLKEKLNEKDAYDDIKVIKTSVPIVKFTDRKTAVKVDVSFNVQTGISSAEFIKRMMSEYRELPYLVLVLKQFLLSRNLLESFNGGISSYCLILLIVSYLQLHPEDRKSGNHGDMLIKFLELYGRHFNYLRTGIKIGNGGTYFRKNENEGELGNRFSLLCIEDPFNPANDVGQGCYGAMKVREEFDKAYRELSDAVLPQYQHIQPVGSSFLGRILLISPEVIQYRRMIREKYSARNQRFVAAFSSFETLSAANDGNLSDDMSSTCSQNSNPSSEQQMTKSNSHSSSGSSSVSPGLSLPSENESDMLSDGTTRNLVQNYQMNITDASFDPGFTYTVISPRVENEFCYPQHCANAGVSGSNSLFFHQTSLPHHLPPSPMIMDLALPPTQAYHLSHHHTSGRSNSWHSAVRSQSLKPSSSSSQRTAVTFAVSAPSNYGSNAVGNPTGSKTFSQATQFSNDRRKRSSNRHENNGAVGGSGYPSNR